MESKLPFIMTADGRGSVVDWTERPRKLHLGCGDRYRDGWTNIDFPQDATVQRRRRAPDIEDDFTKMNFPQGHFDTILLEHVFEHFQRHVAVGLLVQWNWMLKDGGTLELAMPDTEACMVEFLDRKTDDARRKELIRHMYGSHEAPWATHCEGWHEDTLREALEACGFGLCWVSKTPGLKWHEIRATGEKTGRPNLHKIEEFLAPYDAGDGMLAGWMEHIRSKA